MKKSLKIMEYLWITLFFILLVLAIIELINNFFSKNFVILLGLSALSLFMFFARRKLRQKEEQQE